MATNKFHGKAIYQPNGAAYEYGKWACNLYNGCSNQCSYCYNRHCPQSGTLGGDKPTLKMCLKDEDTAFRIFQKELEQNLEQIKSDGGLFFSFVSDPLLPETRDLTVTCVLYAASLGVNCQILTKCTKWFDIPYIRTALWAYSSNIAIGFSLTGIDSMEEHAESTNQERIECMKKLHTSFRVFASIEPVIDCKTSFEMMLASKDYCDFYKVGLATKIHKFWAVLKNDVYTLVSQTSFFIHKPVYWKQSIRRIIGDELCNTQNSVPSDFDIFTIKK